MKIPSIHYPNLGLEAGEKVNEEGVPHRVGNLEDPLLSKEGLHLVPSDDVALLERLDGEVLAGVLVPRKDDLQVKKDFYISGSL